MSCVELREQLPEFAMGVLPERERAAVERHLAWCAGCRKEAADLGQAAATFAYALEPAPVPKGLGDRIVARIRQSAGAPGTRRRARAAATLAVAAMVTVSALGWGAVMAGRAEKFAEQARLAEARRAAALRQFDQVLVKLVPGTVLPTDETHLGQLTPAPGRLGGGAVLQLVSPTVLDFVIVLVNALDPQGETALPYQITLENAAGDVLRVGRITKLDAEGGAEVFRQFEDQDLTGFTRVIVRDASGEVVLAGTVDQSA